VNQIPNPIGSIIYGRNLGCILDPPASQFNFQRRRKGLFVPENRSVTVASQLEAILTPSYSLTPLRQRSLFTVHLSFIGWRDYHLLWLCDHLRGRHHFHFPIAFVS
jgi:hypothetical protein